MDSVSSVELHAVAELRCRFQQSSWPVKRSEYATTWHALRCWLAGEVLRTSEGVRKPATSITVVNSPFGSSSGLLTPSGRACAPAMVGQPPRR